MDLKIINGTNFKKIKFQQWDHDFYKISLNKILAEASTKNKFGGGIYRMYDEAGEIIYVGKSNDIHRRLLQHIGKRTNSAYFIDQVRKIEFHVENSPVFQTMLEGIFIAYHMPKFNDEVKEEEKQNG